MTFVNGKPDLPKQAYGGAQLLSKADWIPRVGPHGSQGRTRNRVGHPRHLRWPNEPARDLTTVAMLDEKWRVTTTHTSIAIQTQEKGRAAANQRWLAPHRRWLSGQLTARSRILSPLAVTARGWQASDSGQPENAVDPSFEWGL